MRPAMELPSRLLSHQPMMLRATSSAVKSSPLFHFTPSRTFKVYCVAFALASQLVSSIGSKDPSLLYSTRYSSQPADTIEICVQSWVRGSLNAFTSICMRIVPPFLAWPPACAGVSRPSKPVSCNGCYTQSCCARQEFATVKFAVLRFLRVHLCSWMHEIVFLGHVFLPVTPNVITDCALGRVCDLLNSN